MKNRGKYIKLIIFFILMFVAIYTIIFSKYDIKEIMNIISKCDMNYIWISILMIALFVLFGAWMLKIMLREFGYKTGMVKDLAYASTEFFFSAITPSSTGGQPAQAYYMAKDGIEVKHSAIILLAIAVIYKFLLVLAGILIYIFMYDLVGPIKVLYIIGLIVNVFMLVAFVMGMFSRKLLIKIGNWCINVFGNLKIIKKVSETKEKFTNWVNEYTESANFIKDRKIMIIKVTILTILQRCAMFIIPYFIYRSMGFEGKSCLYFIIIQVLISLGIDSIPMPAGLGIGEVMNVKMYTAVYPEIIVPSAMILNRVLGFYLCILVSGIITLINHVFTVNKDDANKKAERLAEK